MKIVRIAQSPAVAHVKVTHTSDVSVKKIRTSTSEQLPWYDGEYEVTPTSSVQVLETENKSMRSDVTVKAIPYYDVANVYGRTIYIGGSIDGE